MRLIKLALISFIIFGGILTAMSLLIPSHIRVSRAVTLSRDADSVFYFINNTSQWPKWHPALQGSDSNTLHKNQIILVPVSKTDSLLVIRWQQRGKKPVVNGWQLHRFGTADSVALQWYMDFKLPWYPWQKFGSLLYEGTYGRMMEQGLQHLKVLAQPDLTDSDSLHSRFKYQ
jgi:hypothetical protein